ncbi:hypothetical protein M0804_010605 [Polistes exclamans]|nr:hypothetical protein M0804_010605 [Polistes exclamans]
MKRLTLSQPLYFPPSRFESNADDGGGGLSMTTGYMPSGRFKPRLTRIYDLDDDDNDDDDYDDDDDDDELLEREKEQDVRSQCQSFCLPSNRFPLRYCIRLCIHHHPSSPMLIQRKQLPRWLQLQLQLQLQLAS